MEEDLSEASAGDSVTITLKDQVDISRGNLIVRNDLYPNIGQDIKLMICWFNEKPLKVGGKYIIRNYSNETAGIIKSVNYRMNINTLEKDTTDLNVNMNDIANITIKTSKQAGLRLL